MESGLTPLDHFIRVGWKKRCKPNPWFDNDLYQKYIPSEDCEFFDWLMKVEIKDFININTSFFSEKSFFDEKYYLERNPDYLFFYDLEPVEHFFERGIFEGRSPHLDLSQKMVRSFIDKKVFLDFVSCFFINDKNMARAVNAFFYESIQNTFDFAQLFYPQSPATWDSLDNMYVKKCYEQIFECTQLDLLKKRALLKEQSKKKFFNTTQSDKEATFLSHRIWITPNESPHEVPQYCLSAYASSIKKLPQESWSHRFWCLKKELIPESVAFLENNGVIVCEVFNDCPAILAVDIINFYLQNNYFTFASDVIRINILFQFGGLYSDVGSDFLIDLTKILNKYDYAFFQPNNSQNIDVTTMFVHSKNDLLFEKWLFFLDNIRTNFDFDFDENFTKTMPLLPQLTGGSFLNTLFLHQSNSETSVLFIPENSIIQYLNRLDSYSGKSSFGNTPVDWGAQQKSKVDFIDTYTGGKLK